MENTLSVSHEVKVKVSQEKAFEFHSELTNISKVVPPFLKVVVTKVEYPINIGSEAELVVLLFGFLPIFAWKLRFVDYDEPYVFVDEAIGGFFKHFRHTHRFIQIGSNLEKSIIKDTIEFSSGNKLIDLIIKPLLSLALIIKLSLTQKKLFLTSKLE